ncbi:MAG: 50S ribosomal protein L25 [Candidatus Moranbacteria bacterium]|nr:50S ribosomal protein L25 [Candidatus Moranbacteria bacterium]
MSKGLNLAVTKREKQSTKEIVAERKLGKIPAVLYSHGQEAEMLWIDYITFSKVYKVAGHSSVVTLEGAKKNLGVIIQEIQLHPLSGRFSHVDLYQVHMDEALEAQIPLVFTGTAAAVRELGGMLVKTLEEVEVSCLPKDLPHEIEVDIQTLATFEDNIKIKDIKLPKGVTMLVDAETVVALVEAPRSEEEMAALDEKVTADVTKVEGVTKEADKA